MSSAEEVMATHGKSFHFASLLFSRKQFQKIAHLYRICRGIDDTADENEARYALPALAEIRAQITDPARPGQWQEWVSAAEAEGVSREHLLDLLSGADFDVRGGEIADEQMLKQYCYWVAGVVGLMMCPLLGTQDPKAQRHAVALGMGMQLTNICRDVKEDALNGRVYLPLNRLARAHLSVKDITERDATPDSLREIVAEHLALADQFYSEGYRGLSYLPLRPRVVIVVAGEVYRHIGIKLRARKFDVLAGRVHLTLLQKILVALKSVGFLFRREFWRPTLPVTAS